MYNLSRSMIDIEINWFMKMGRCPKVNISHVMKQKANAQNAASVCSLKLRVLGFQQS